MKGQKAYTKIQSIKAPGSGAEISPEMLAKINRFALKDLTADDVYVRKFLLAHSAIDRDNERFPEGLIAEFAATLPGKSFLTGHSRMELGTGLFFDAATEEMSPEKFLELTGETPRLPEGKTTITVLWSWIYVLKSGFNEQLMANVDAGIYRHVSIGFRAADITAIKDDPNGPVLYWEYVAPGEATEGSLVWLGAQPGATAQKALDGEKEVMLNNAGYRNAVKLIDAGKVDKESSWSFSAADSNALLGDPPDWKAYARWFLGKDSEAGEETKARYKYPFGKDGKVYRSALTAIRQRASQQDVTDVFDAAGRLIDRIDEEKSSNNSQKGGKEDMKDFLKRISETLGKTLTEDNAIQEIAGVVSSKDAEIATLKEKVTELEPLAVEGKAYRKELVEAYVTLRTKLEEIKADDEEKQKQAREVAGAFPVEFLKSEVEVLEKRIKEKFDDKGQLKTGDPEARGAGEKKNPLVPEDEK